jgi:hypothetical protein
VKTTATGRGHKIRVRGGGYDIYMREAGMRYVVCLSAAEAIIGLLIEIRYLATYTQCFFGSK